MSRQVFPAHRTRFVVDLAAVESDLLPSGLRLVEAAGDDASGDAATREGSSNVPRRHERRNAT